jgi:hypothetical protein
MTLEADSLAERRRLKRRLRIWRIGAILLAVVAVVGVIASREGGMLEVVHVGDAVVVEDRRDFQRLIRGALSRLPSHVTA